MNGQKQKLKQNYKGLSYLFICLLFCFSISNLWAAISNEELKVIPREITKVQDFSKIELKDKKHKELNLSNFGVVPHSVFRSDNLLSMSFYVDLYYYASIFSQGTLKIQGEILFEFNNSKPSIRIIRSGLSQPVSKFTSVLGLNKIPDDEVLESLVLPKLQNFIQNKDNFDAIMAEIQNSNAELL